MQKYRTGAWFGSVNICTTKTRYDGICGGEAEPFVLHLRLQRPLNYELMPCSKARHDTEYMNIDRKD